MNKNWKSTDERVFADFFHCCDDKYSPTTLCTILFMNDIALEEYTVWALVPSGTVWPRTAPALQGMSSSKTAETAVSHTGILDT